MIIDQYLILSYVSVIDSQVNPVKVLISHWFAVAHVLVVLLSLLDFEYTVFPEMN